MRCAAPRVSLHNRVLFVCSSFAPFLRVCVLWLTLVFCFASSGCLCSFFFYLVVVHALAITLHSRIASAPLLQPHTCTHTLSLLSPALCFLFFAVRKHCRLPGCFFSNVIKYFCVVNWPPPLIRQLHTFFFTVLPRGFRAAATSHSFFVFLFIAFC